jgi:hypothetical protein
MRSRTAFITRVAMAFAMLLLTPLAFKAGEGVERNSCSAQADGPTCAREIDSVCTAGSTPVMNWYTLPR